MTKVKPSSWALFTIVTLFFVPLFLAWVLYRFQIGLPTHTTNHGQLINPPVIASELAFTTKTGEAIKLSHFHGRWLMLYFNPAACLDACKKEIYFMRQVHTALGKNQQRVQRLFVSGSKKQTNELASLLDSQYSKMKVVFAKPSERISFYHALKKPNEVKYKEGHLYIIDPLGNMMMEYDINAPAKGILKDLKKLLRVSQIG